MLDNILVYLEILNRGVSRDDFTRALPSFPNDLPVNLISRGLAPAGMVSRVLHNSSFDTSKLPILIKLRENRYAVLLRVEGTDCVLTDSQVKNGEYKVSKQELQEQYDGLSVIAQPDIHDLQRRHVGEETGRHWFWGSFGKQKKLITDVVLSSLVANLLAVTVSLFALQVYDRVIPHQSTTTLWVLAAGCLLAITLEAMLRISRAHLMDVSGKKIELDVSAMLFRKLSDMRLSKRPSSPGSLVYSLREFSSVREFFTATSIGSVADIPFVGIFLLLIYAIAGNIVWIILTAMIVIIVPSIISQSRMSRLSKEMLGGSAAAGKLLTELAYGHETVKTTRAERLFQTKWEEINTLNAAKTTEQRTLAAGLTYWSTSVQQMAYIASVVAGVYFVFSGEFTVGTIIAVSILSTRTLAPVTQLAGALARWQQVKCALHGLGDIAESEQERPYNKNFARKTAIHGDISVQDLTYSHTPEEPVFLNIPSLQIESGASVALLGENGSGKSTLLKILSGLYDFNSGSVLIDGLDIRQLDPEDLRNNIAYLPQDPKLFSGTIRDNLTLGRNHYSEAQLFESLAFSGLDQLISSHARGLDIEILDGGEGISIGQRQSLTLSRLYLQEPGVVLMDEPTASLDQNIEARVVANLEQWLQGKTCIVATHRVPILSVVSRIIVLKQGRVAMDDNRNAVMNTLTSKAA